MKLAKLAAVTAALMLSTNASAAVVYTIQDLGTLGGYSAGSAVNASGQVAGESVNSAGQQNAFRTGPDGMPMTNLGVLNDDGNPATGFSTAFDINDSGQTVGYSTSGSNLRGFRTDAAGTMTELGTFGGMSQANGINNAGRVVGTSVAAGPVTRAFVTDADLNMTMLPTLGGASNWGNDINDANQVTGYSLYDSNPMGSVHAFRVNADGSGLIDLGTINGLEGGSEGSAINSLGQVTGSSVAGPNWYHAFRTSADGSVMTDLGTIGGYDGASYGYGINDSGYVVGTSATALGNRAFYHDGSAMLDLNTLIDPLAGWTLTAARDINNLGQITGVGTHNGQTRAFLLTLIPAPVPEPSTWAMLIAGFGLVGGALRRRRPASLPGPRKIVLGSPKRLALFAAAGALLFVPAAHAAVISKSYLFTAAPGFGPTPAHTGSFSLTYDDVTLAADLVSIDYQIGATVYDTTNAEIGPDVFAGQLTLYGSLNGTSIYPGTDDFRLVFNPTSDTGVVFTYSQVGYDGFSTSGAEGTILVNTTPGVPEPATWAMLIAGFCLVGGTLRSRRRSLALA